MPQSAPAHQPRRTWQRIAAGATGAALALSGCGLASSDNHEPTTLTVYAAASLKKPFTELGAAFEKANPGVRVKFNFAGSSDLAAQIKAGAPADVLATADTRTMGLVTAQHLMASDPQVFTRNQLAIIVPKGNPHGVRQITDLGKSGLKLVVCAPAVPCGKAAEKFEHNAKLTLHPVSEETKVTDVVAKVTSGDGEAGIVYVSDAKSAGNTVETVAIPAGINVVNDYPIGVLKDSEHADLAKKFNQLVVGETGQRALVRAGFTPTA